MRSLAVFVFSCAGLAASPIIDDHALVAKLQRSLAEVAERDGHVTGKELADQLKEAPAAGSFEGPCRADSDARMNYDDDVQGVVMVGSVFKCGKCDQWHLGGAASGWVLSADGLIVTNYHVFESSDREAYGVMTLDGKFAEIRKVEAASKAADIAVLRVDGEGFTPLPIAETVQVGEPVHVISHPSGRFFTYTSGRVSRMFARRVKGEESPVTCMAITADFARGSSGGPVLNDRGEVVGMVASTDTIYYHGNHPNEDNGNAKDDQGPAQMVIKNCVSLDTIRALQEKADQPTADVSTEPSSEGATPGEEAPKQTLTPGVPMLVAPRDSGQGVPATPQQKGAPLVPLVPKVAPEGEDAPPPAGPESLIGKPLADFTLPVIDGTNLTKPSAAGKVLLIDFWASWCGPCKAASPILQELHNELSERGLMVIGANTSERDREGNSIKTPDIAAAYAKKHNYTYTFTYGSDELKDACLVRGLPTMMIVDRVGTVRDVVVGFSKDLKTTLTEKITPLLEKQEQ